ncbi:MAG: hypothetical protein QM731_14195 [Chitinophagaceae bacterium]
MKKFLLLRILAIVYLVVVSFAFIIQLATINNERNTTDAWAFFCLMISLINMICQSIVILIIYHKYYPATEIRTSSMVFHRIVFVSSWVCQAFLLFAVVGFFFTDSDISSLTQEDFIIAGTVLLIIAINIIQTLGARRIVKTIRKNYFVQLEEAFA